MPYIKLALTVVLKSTGSWPTKPILDRDDSMAQVCPGDHAKRRVAENGAYLTKKDMPKSLVVFLHPVSCRSSEINLNRNFFDCRNQIGGLKYRGVVKPGAHDSEHDAEPGWAQNSPERGHKTA